MVGLRTRTSPVSTSWERSLTLGALGDFRGVVHPRSNSQTVSCTSTLVCLILTREILHVVPTSTPDSLHYSFTVGSLSDPVQCLVVRGTRTSNLRARTGPLSWPLAAGRSADSRLAHPPQLPRDRSSLTRHKLGRRDVPTTDNRCADSQTGVQHFPFSLTVSHTSYSSCRVLALGPRPHSSRFHR